MAPCGCSAVSLLQPEVLVAGLVFAHSGPWSVGTSPIPATFSSMSQFRNGLNTRAVVTLLPGKAVQPPEQLDWLLSQSAWCRHSFLCHCVCARCRHFPLSLRMCKVVSDSSQPESKSAKDLSLYRCSVCVCRG